MRIKHQNQSKIMIIKKENKEKIFFLIFCVYLPVVDFANVFNISNPILIIIGVFDFIFSNI